MKRLCFFFFLLLSTYYGLGQGTARKAGRTPAPDSVTAPTSLKYSDPSVFQQFFLGTNYRAVWSTPVKAPVLRLSQTGLTIEELGGGQQTKSLQLADKEGREWALRSVDKDVTFALPKLLRHT